MREVEPLPPHLPVDPPDPLPRLTATVGAALTQRPLSVRQPFGGRGKVARVGDVDAFAGGHKRRHPEINPGDRAGRLQRLGGYASQDRTRYQRRPSA